ncbi:MAG: hypothetical protein J5994_01585 [Ruminococcus sp.]|nr:hypothetical protein [Ruminococcus sp.]
MYQLTNNGICDILIMGTVHWRKLASAESLTGLAVSPEREVITMVTYSDMFLFATVLIGVIALCYDVFKKEVTHRFLGKNTKKKHRPIDQN